MNNLIKYSQIKKKGNLIFLKKKYNKTNNTILYDIGLSDDETNSLLKHKNLKNLVIDTNTHNGINIHNTSAENIYFLDSEKLGGITIPYNKIIANDRGYYFSWNRKNPSNINKINIIGNEVKTIDVNNLESVEITWGNNYHVYIEVEDKKSIIKYIINTLKNIKTIKITYFITKDDITNCSSCDYEEGKLPSFSLYYIIFTFFEICSKINKVILIYMN